MIMLNPDRLNITFFGGITAEGPLKPRTYTLTHSDTTGDLFLSIGPSCNLPQISSLYTRLMRDEVWAEWEMNEPIALHVHCHVSGGLVIGTANWRDSIFRQHLPMVLQAFWYGDQKWIGLDPRLSRAKVIVHFHATQKKLNRLETWGMVGDYKFNAGK